MKFAGIFTVAVAVGLTAPSLTRAESPNSPNSEAEQAAWKACLSSNDALLRKLKVSPERYEMAMLGGCYKEQLALTDALTMSRLADFRSSWPEEFKNIYREKTVRFVYEFPAQMRRQFITDYVMWYGDKQALGQ